MAEVRNVPGEEETGDEHGALLDQVHILHGELKAQSRRLAEARAELLTQRTLHENLLQRSPLPYLVTDAAGKIERVNDAASALLGVERELLVGKPLLALVPVPAGRELRRRLARLPHEHGPAEVSLPFETRGGAGPFTATAMVSIDANADGSVSLRWLLHPRPSDADRRREETQAADHDRVRHERDLMRRTLERLEAGVVTIDSELQVVFANTAAQHLIGAGTPLPGRSLPDPWPSVSLRELALTLFERTGSTADARVELDDGRTIGVYGIAAHASLTAILVLRDLTREARRDHAEREFVTNAAHELRTPLTAITGAIEVLQAGAKEQPDERDLFLSHIEAQTYRLRQLARALLLLARAQAGGDEPRIEVVPLAPLLEQAAAHLRPGKDVQVRVECADDVAVLANADLLAQAIASVADNAVKYTRSGEIVLAGSRRARKGVRIEVSDSGDGMPAELQARAFERFSRGAAQVDGFGLGLAIASEAVRVCGGRLEVESEPGRGTRVWTMLPSARLLKR
jgi:two-component system phosphate regulon sensor histidine kinase PhoR